MCEIIKDGSQQDDGFGFIIQWLSLIEFIYVDDFADFQFTENKIGFDYLGEKRWFGVLSDNCEITEQRSDQVLKKSLKYLEEYFDWEEQEGIKTT
jgi:hypothetical protein